MVKEVLFTCEFCSQPFMTEGGFAKHNCEQKKRDKFLTTLEGQMAWGYYKSWMKEKHHCAVGTSSAFKSSRYFKAFSRFATFVKKSNIPDVQEFIILMTKNRIEPPRWTDDAAYGKYISHITKTLPFYKLEEITIKTLLDIAEVADIDVSTVFDVVQPNEVIQLLHQRRLFPWVLLKSKKFAKFVMENTTSEEKIILENIINPGYWDKRFKNNPKEVKNVMVYIHELGL